MVCWPYLNRGCARQQGIDILCWAYCSGPMFRANFGGGRPGPRPQNTGPRQPANPMMQLAQLAPVILIMILTFWGQSASQPVCTSPLSHPGEYSIGFCQRPNDRLHHLCWETAGTPPPPGGKVNTRYSPEN